ncbi:putative Co/Zn/Cd cation transporter [Allocoleopsis franciscana PCC 7113]|uniref:Putative Co/Zn/Cd cation transporter n=2 Tax=Allocoleopsis TaxID=2886347 RepID=K9WDH8_9CYAN|nr:putative Co/Zn/Cd cation transporter [Allocoleopsis franciscana PCC 7113]
MQHQAMTEGQNRAQGVRQILFTSFWLMLLILSVKVSVGWRVRSLSLMAESLHTLLTSVSTFLSLLTLKAYRPNGYPIYGQGKREVVITFVLIAILGFAGLNLIGLSAQQLIGVISGGTQSFPVRVSWPLMQVLGVLVVASLGMAILGLYQGRVLSHPALRFNAGQLFKDVLLTLLVIGGLVGVWVGIRWLDVFLAIVLVLLAAGSCWQVVSWQFPLMVEQTAIAPEVLAQIARQVGGVTHCYHIRSRGLVGRLVYVQMHLIVHPDLANLTPLIAERIETFIQERYGPVHVTFFIVDDIAGSANFNQSPSVTEVNGKNDPTGRSNS